MCMFYLYKEPKTNQIDFRPAKADDIYNINYA